MFPGLSVSYTRKRSERAKRAHSLYGIYNKSGHFRQTNHINRAETDRNQKRLEVWLEHSSGRAPGSDAGMLISYDAYIAGACLRSC